MKNAINPLFNLHTLLVRGTCSEAFRKGTFTAKFRSQSYKIPLRIYSRYTLKTFRTHFVLEATGFQEFLDPTHNRRRNLRTFRAYACMHWHTDMQVSLLDELSLLLVRLHRASSINNAVSTTQHPQRSINNAASATQYQQHSINNAVSTT